jgi:hypothetical protein
MCAKADFVLRPADLWLVCGRQMGKRLTDAFTTPDVPKPSSLAMAASSHSGKIYLTVKLKTSP